MFEVVGDKDIYGRVESFFDIFRVCFGVIFG